MWSRALSFESPDPEVCGGGGKGSDWEEQPGTCVLTLRMGARAGLEVGASSWPGPEVRQMLNASGGTA